MRTGGSARRTTRAPLTLDRVRVERRLRGSEPRDRHPEGRAADVVQAGHVEERDRIGVAAVLAAYPELEPRVPLAADPCGQSHQPANAGLVDRLERAAVDDLLLEVSRQDPAFDVVAREAERALGQVVGAEREEVRTLGDLVR